MKATKIKDLPVSSSGARQALYKLDTPYEVRDFEGYTECVTEYVVASAVMAMFSGPETYIFPADSDGKIIDWGELPGSYRGGLDHDLAIQNFEDSVDYIDVEVVETKELTDGS